MIPPRAALFLGVVVVSATSLAHCGSSSSKAASPKDGGGGDVSAGEGGGGEGGDAAEAGTDAAPQCTASPDAIGTTTRNAGGQPYLSYAPASYDKTKPGALVVGLHPTGVPIDYYLTNYWQANADSQGFLVITPSGTNVPAAGGYVWRREDEAAILAAIDDVSACYSIDPRRIIIDGWSGGAIMSYWLGLRHAKRFAGISIQAADLVSAEGVNGGPLVPAPALIPISHTHGLQDQVFLIPFAEEGRDELVDAGHPFQWHTFDGGHTGATAEMALQRYMDLQDAAAVSAQDGVPPLFPATDGGACNATPNTAPAIAVQQVASSSPTPMGGPAMADGTYFATAFTIYTGTGGAAGPSGVTYRGTSILSGGASSYVSSESDDDAGAQATNYAPFGYAGNAISLTTTCPYIQKSTFIAYDSDATHLTLYTSTTAAAGVQALTFTKQ